MFEYKFVQCRCLFQGGTASVDPIRQEVERHAREGWRLVQVLVLVPAAVPDNYELIFERPRPVS